MVLLYIYRSATKNIKNHVTKNYFSKSACLSDPGEKIREALFVPVQREKAKKPRKISIVGAAGVSGRTIAYNIIRSRYICDEMVMMDIPDRKIQLCGEILDFLHAGMYFGIPNIKLGLDLQKTAESDLIILTSGVPRKEGQSRLDVVQTNVDIFKKIVPSLAEHSPDCVFLVVANPVDILGYATLKYSGFEKNRVLGTGTSVDSSRFSYYLSERLGINPFSIKASIIAEHGDSSVPVWSMVNVANTRLRDIDRSIGTCEDNGNWNSLYKSTKNAGASLIKRKGFTNWSIGVAAAKITEAIIRDYKTVHTVSICANGLHGIESNCFMSFPVVLGNRGVKKVVLQEYDNDEICKLQESVCVLDAAMDKVQF